MTKLRVSRIHFVTNNYLVMWAFEQAMVKRVDYIVEKALMINNVTHCNSYVLTEPILCDTEEVLKKELKAEMGVLPAGAMFDMSLQIMSR